MHVAGWQRSAMGDGALEVGLVDLRWGRVLLTVGVFTTRFHHGQCSCHVCGAG